MAKAGRGAGNRLCTGLKPGEMGMIRIAEPDFSLGLAEFDSPIKKGEIAAGLGGIPQLTVHYPHIFQTIFDRSVGEGFPKNTGKREK